MIDFIHGGDYPSSFMELKIEKILIANEIEFYREVIFENLINPKTGKELRFDFYLPHQNFLIEYDGLDYHKSQDAKYRDSLKDKFSVEYEFALHRLQGMESIEEFFINEMNIDPTPQLQKKNRRKKSEKYDGGSYIDYYKEDIDDYIEAAIKDPEMCYKMAFRARTNTTWWFYNVIAKHIPIFKPHIKISHLKSQKNIIINSLIKNPPERRVKKEEVDLSVDGSEIRLSILLSEYGKQFEK